MAPVFGGELDTGAWDIAAVPRHNVERQSLPKADVNSLGAD